MAVGDVGGGKFLPPNWMRCLLHSVKHGALAGEIVVAVFHGQCLSVWGEGPTVAEVHLARSELEPCFDDELLTIPSRASAERVAVRLRLGLIAVGVATEHCTGFGSVGLGDDDFFV